MAGSQVYTELLILAGAGTMLLSILATRKVLALLAGGKYLRFWHSLIFLMVFFFFGYLAAIGMIAAGLGEHIILLTGVVFLFGALFVYIVVYLGRITIEDLLQAREKAEAHSRAKGAFLANMSHELRTPLNHIIGYTEIVHEDLQATGDPALLGDLERIRSAAEDLLRLVDNVLELARIEDGRTGLDLADFDVVTLIREAAAQCQPLITRNRNRFETRLPEDLGSMHSDAGKLRQIVSNILSNAARFTKDGFIEVDASAVDLDLPESRGKLVLRITDNGIGMSEALLQRIFEPFERAENSSAGEHRGMGLGLAITRKLCRLLGGDISVESREGSGSAFTITVPLDLRGRAGTI